MRDGIMKDEFKTDETMRDEDNEKLGNLFVLAKSR